MLGELSYRLGRRLRSRLLQVVCSSSWLDAITPVDANGFVRAARCGLYPPGGESTAMRECSACRRISPPNRLRVICGDCEIENAELAFSQRCARSTRSQRCEFQRLWWRSPLRFVLSDDDDSAAPTWTSVVQNPAGVIRGWEQYEESTDGIADEFSPMDDDPADPTSDSDETSRGTQYDRPPPRSTSIGYWYSAQDSSVGSLPVRKWLRRMTLAGPMRFGMCPEAHVAVCARDPNRPPRGRTA